MIDKSCVITCNGFNSLKDIKSAMSSIKPPNRIFIISCDGACEFLRKHKIIPNIIIGDLDSITDDTYKYFKSKQTKIIKQINQNKNDLEKAIEFALKSGYKEIYITGIAGKRLDHTLNNLSIVKKFRNKAKLKIYESGYRGEFIGKSYKLNTKIGKTFSLIPFPKAEGIITKGLKYRLLSESLELGKREGGLNKSISREIEINYKKGLILLISEQ